MVRLCGDLAVRENLGGRGHVAGIERPELGVAGRGFVEPHAVDDFFEILRVGGPERDAPFPVFDAEADRDELRHAAGERHAARGVLDHQPAALLLGQREPVLADLALLVHRVEAGRAVRRKIGREPLAVHIDQAVGVALHAGFVLGAARRPCLRRRAARRTARPIARTR